MTRARDRDARRRRRHGIRKLRNLIAEILVPFLIRVYFGTLRIRAYQAGPWHPDPRRREPVIYAFWHEAMLSFAYTHCGRRVTTLISEHADGELIARVIERLGFQCVRGSTTRGGTRAVLAMVRRSREGRDLAVTPDGPRGPRRRFRMGTIGLAAASGRRILLGINVYSAYWELPTWDRLQIPKPFARVLLRPGLAVRVSPGLPADGREALRSELEENLNALADETTRDFDRLWRDALPFPPR